jgi:hypothetical protein
MDNWITFSTIYTTTLVITLRNEEGEGGEGEVEEEYTLSDWVGQDEEKQKDVVELLNITN